VRLRALEESFTDLQTTLTNKDFADSRVASIINWYRLPLMIARTK